MSDLEIKPTARMRLRVLAIVGIAACLSLALVYLFISRGGNVFTAKSDIFTVMPDASGVSEGSPVRLSGIQIGVVSGVGLTGSSDPQAQVRVRMTVRTHYLRDIPIDSTTDVGALTLIGDKYVDINEGKSAAPLPPGGTMPSEPVKQASDRADLLHAMADELRQIDSVLATMSDPHSQLGHFIVASEEYDATLDRLKQFDSAVRSLVSPTSQIGQMLFTNGLYDSLHDNVMRMDSRISAVQQGQGAAGHLYASDKQYDDLVRSVGDLRKTLATWKSGQGPAGAALTSDAAYVKLTNALTGLDNLLNDFDTGNGRMAELMRSPQMYESLNGSLESLAELLRDFREHPGKYMRYQVFGGRKKKKTAR